MFIESTVCNCDGCCSWSHFILLQAKQKKIRDKYADQDEVERQMRMEILAVSGRERNRERGRGGREGGMCCESHENIKLCSKVPVAVCVEWESSETTESAATTALGEGWRKEEPQVKERSQPTHQPQTQVLPPEIKGEGTAISSTSSGGQPSQANGPSVCDHYIF